MFKAELKDKIQRIFDLGKVTYDLPSSSKEQECAFIEIIKTSDSIQDGRVLSMVTGKLHVFANVEKLPFGYFSKKISASKHADTKAFFFYDEENKGTYQNIVERDLSFIYFFDSQYDPDVGTINSITLTED